MIAIIGTKWGHFLGTQLRKVYSGPLMICGRDPLRTERVAKLLRAHPLPGGWETAVAHPKIQTLILAIPPKMHAQVALAALHEGKHVLVEKPLAMNLEDCDRMIESALKNDVVLSVGENIPYRPAILEARRLMPLIGNPRLLLACALHGPAYQDDTGILLDFAIHYVRAVRFLLGDPSGVYAMGGADNATLVLSGDAWKANISLSWQAAAGRNPEFILAGDEGALKIWPESRAVDFYPVAPSLLTRAVERIRPWWLQQRLQSPELQRRRFRVPRRDRMGYQAELRHFLTAVGHNQGDVSSAIEGRRDIEVAMAAKMSFKMGYIVG